jgi:hypothetical protein
VALSVTAACKSDEGPEELEASAGAEAVTAEEAAAEGEPVVARRNAETAADDPETPEADASDAESLKRSGGASAHHVVARPLQLSDELNSPAWERTILDTTEG